MLGVADSEGEQTLPRGDAGGLNPAGGQRVLVPQRGATGDALGDLIHVVKPQPGDGGRQVRALKQAAARDTGPGIGDVGHPDDTPRARRRRVDLPGPLDPEGVPGLPGLRGQDLRRGEGGAVQPLAVERETVAMTLNAGPVAPEPGEGLGGHLRVIRDLLGGVDVQGREGGHRRRLGDPDELGGRCPGVDGDVLSEGGEQVLVQVLGGVGAAVRAARRDRLDQRPLALARRRGGVDHDTCHMVGSGGAVDAVGAVGSADAGPAVRPQGDPRTVPVVPRGEREVLDGAAVAGGPLAPVGVVDRHGPLRVRVQVDRPLADGEGPRLNVVRVGGQRRGGDQSVQAVGLTPALPQLVGRALARVPHAVRRPARADGAGAHEQGRPAGTRGSEHRAPGRAPLRGSSGSCGPREGSGRLKGDAVVGRLGSAHGVRCGIG